MQILENSNENHIQEILQQMDIKYLVPEFYIVKKWSISNDQVKVAYLYTRNGITLNIKALYQACISYLQKNEISPTKKVIVGGNLHKYDPPKKILSLAINYGSKKVHWDGIGRPPQSVRLARSKVFNRLFPEFKNFQEAKEYHLRKFHLGEPSKD